MGKAILFGKGPLLVKIIVKALEAESWGEIAVLQIPINNSLFGKYNFFLKILVKQHYSCWIHLEFELHMV